MAGLALVRADDVIRRLTRRNGAVVAAEAGGGSGKVVEPGHAEGPDTMTLAAIQVGQQVGRRFARCRKIVVTNLAARGCATVDLVTMAVTAEQCPVSPLKRKSGEFMIELGSPGGTRKDTKTDRIVAGVAILASGHMTGRHAQPNYAIVAALALRGDTFVLLIDMAGLATERAVGAIRGDAGGIVVVFFFIGRQ